VKWFLDGVTWESDRRALKQTDGRVHFSFAGKELAGIPPQDIQVKQVHGVRIVPVTSENQASCSTQEADGVFATEVGFAVGVKTADCVPVLIYEKNGNAAAALHAGWRGMFAGIVPAAIELFAQSGFSSDSLRVHVGPCISSAKFEVGPEVVEAFVQSCSWLDREVLPYALSKGVGDRWHIDLALVAAAQAHRRGVHTNAIVVHRHCTYLGPEHWNSFRRDGRVVASNWSSIQLLAR